MKCDIQQQNNAHPNTNPTDCDEVHDIAALSILQMVQI